MRPTCRLQAAPMLPWGPAVSRWPASSSSRGPMRAACSCSRIQPPVPRWITPMPPCCAAGWPRAGMGCWWATSTCSAPSCCQSYWGLVSRCCITWALWRRLLRPGRCPQCATTPWWPLARRCARAWWRLACRWRRHRWCIRVRAPNCLVLPPPVGPRRWRQPWPWWRPAIRSAARPIPSRWASLAC